MNLWNLPNYKKDAIEFFQEKGLLPSHRQYKDGHKKKLYIGKNEVFWKCNIKAYQHKSNMRNGW